MTSERAVTLLNDTSLRLKVLDAHLKCSGFFRIISPYVDQSGHHWLHNLELL